MVCSWSPSLPPIIVLIMTQRLAQPRKVMVATKSHHHYSLPPLTLAQFIMELLYLEKGIIVLAHQVVTAPHQE
jgi:hypothetical protein